MKNLFTLAISYIILIYTLQGQDNSRLIWDSQLDDVEGFFIHSLNIDKNHNFIITGLKKEGVYQKIIDEKGNHKKFVFIKNDLEINKITAVNRLDNGNYLLAGISKEEDSLLFGKINAKGKIIMVSSLPLQITGKILSINHTKDRGYIMAGEEDGDLLVVRTNKKGNVIWKQNFGNYGRDLLFKVLELPNGNFILAGCTDDFDSGMLDMWVMEVDKNNGENIWEKTFGEEQSAYDAAHDIILSPEGHPIILGNQGDSIFIFDLKKNKDLRQKISIGEKGERCRGYAMAWTAKGTIALVGKISNLETKKTKLYLSKIKYVEREPSEVEVKDIKGKDKISQRLSIKVLNRINPLDDKNIEFQKTDVKNTNGIYKVIGKPWTVGKDQFQFEATANKNSFLYMFGINPMNEVTVHFPRKKGNSATPSGAYLIPEEGKQLSLSYEGIQHIIFLCSATEIKDFENRVQTISKLKGIDIYERLEKTFPSENLLGIPDKFEGERTISAWSTKQGILPLVLTVSGRVGDLPNPNVERPNLYVLSIGYNAEGAGYSENDAKDISDIFERKTFVNYNNTYVKSIIGEEATKSTILRELEMYAFMMDEGEISKEDVIWVFFSGHGSVIQNEWVYKPAGYSAATPKSTGISFKELEGFLENLHCKKIIIMDAGNVGFIKKTKVEQLNIITACSSKQNVEEHKSWKNGAFTEVLLKTLKEKNEGNLTIGKLWQTLNKELPILVKIKFPKKTQIPNLISKNKEWVVLAWE